MKTTLVVYKSKYGSSEKYAHWIAEELKADIVELANVDLESLADYDTIIYGAGLYPSGIAGVSFIKDNFESIRDKNLVLFTVGLTLTDDEKTFDAINKRNLTHEMLDRIEIFHLRGAMDYKNLAEEDRLMMDKLKEMLDAKNPAEVSESYKSLLDGYGSKLDFVKKENIRPIIDYLRS